MIVYRRLDFKSPNFTEDDSEQNLAFELSLGNCCVYPLVMFEFGPFNFFILWGFPVNA